MKKSDSVFTIYLRKKRMNKPEEKEDYAKAKGQEKIQRGQLATALLV